MPRNWPHGMLLPSYQIALTVTTMDMLQQIALTKYHLQEHQQYADMTDQHLSIIATPGIPTVTTGTGTDSSQSQSHST